MVNSGNEKQKLSVDEKFTLSLDNADPGISTPDWVKNAVFYQIFPDRFARSDKTVLPNGIKLQDWDAPGDLRGFYGGDLNGVTEKLDYLQELGINAIYFNPIFQATTYHRYNTYDYYKVDPLLGGNEALRKLMTRHISGILRLYWTEYSIIADGDSGHSATYSITGRNPPTLIGSRSMTGPSAPIPMTRNNPQPPITSIGRSSRACQNSTFITRVSGNISLTWRNTGWNSALTDGGWMWPRRSRTPISGRTYAKWLKQPTLMPIL